MIKRSDDARIVVTGLAPFCSLGIGREEVWRAAQACRTNLVKIPYALDGDEWGQFYLHRMPHFNIDALAIPKQNLDFVRSLRGFRRNDPDLDYLVAGVSLALADSRLAYDPAANDIGLVATHENPGMESFFEDIIDSAHGRLADMKQAPTKVQLARALYGDCEEGGYSLQTFTYLYSVAKVFDLHGYSLFINNACASGLFAVEAAANQLRAGLNSAVVVAAVDSPLKIYKYEWFRKKGLYAEDGMVRPFSKGKSGIVFGDGGAALVLETLTSARTRGARIYAEYLGGGFTLEGWKITVPDVGSNFYERSFAQAFRRSGIGAGDIDLINPHGVGMKVTDRYEARTIKAVFGDRVPPVTALKSLVGHNLGGSALLETVLSLLMLENDFILPTLNCDDPEERIGFSPVREGRAATLRTIAKAALGFAGFNGVVLFAKQ